MRERHDIKAPDGFLLGGERVVRQDGTVLFHRGWWQLPDNFADPGEYVWVHEEWLNRHGSEWLVLEVAPPGYSSFYAAKLDQKTVIAERTKRPDAKPGWRNPVHKAWSERRA